MGCSRLPFARRGEGVGGVRPAWAHACRCKSCCELVTVSKAKRNCMRMTECGKEAWSVNRESMDKNCIVGAARQGERAPNREALVTKGFGGVYAATVR